VVSGAPPPAAQAMRWVARDTVGWRGVHQAPHRLGRGTV